MDDKEREALKKILHDITAIQKGLFTQVHWLIGDPEKLKGEQALNYVVLQELITRSADRIERFIDGSSGDSSRTSGNDLRDSPDSDSETLSSCSNRL